MSKENIEFETLVYTRYLYSVIEVNATPGLDHYASSGVEQSRIVDQLYTKVLNTL
jgi:hypothetical protein